MTRRIVIGFGGGSAPYLLHSPDRKPRLATVNVAMSPHFTRSCRRLRKLEQQAGDPSA